MSDHLIRKPLIVSLQGTLGFLLIEVAVQRSLFDSEPESSLTEVDELTSVTEQDILGKARNRAWTKVSFFL